jgi:exonuclease III
MRNLRILLLFLILATIFLSGCNRPDVQNFSFAFYNLENLFDTINDPNVKDDNNLPSSKIAWNAERYNQKLKNVAKVLSSTQKKGFPSLYGLCEVENKNVIEDLLKQPELKKAGYKYLHKDSRDDRGLDVALLYNPKDFKLLDEEYIDIFFPGEKEYGIRYILHAKGLTPGNDTIHVFVNHWVSRWEGQQKTEPYRMFTAEKLYSIVQNVFEVDKRANIIIAGDFNDNPTDNSLVKGLHAIKPQKPLKKGALYNLSKTLYESGNGTVYNNGWDMFDQIIVSASLLSGDNGLQVTSSQQTIIKYKWLLQKNKKGVLIPFRTSSYKYFGGFSDHLPVYIDMRVDYKEDLSSII